MKNILLILLMSGLMSGCWWVKKDDPVAIEHRVEGAAVFHPALPPAASLQRFGDGWKVITPEIIEEYIKDWEKGDADPIVAYVITVEDYEILAKNMAELKRIIRDYKEIIIYYRSLQPDELTPKKDEK